MKNKELNFLSQTFLFCGFSEDEILNLPCEIILSTVLCEKGDRIKIARYGEEKIAFVLSGECEVMSERLVLNTLKKGDSFGILSIFSNEPYPTAIVAKKNSRILFLEKETLLSLIECSPKISLNVIRFLSGRVSFLNRKVATLGSASVEEKCTHLLKDLLQKFGVVIPFPISSMARKLGVGRASLYRSLESLTEKGILRYEDTYVHILCPDQLG